MRLTNHIIRKKVKELASKPKRRSHFRSLEDARHILVLFDAADREVVEACLPSLRKLNKHIDVCAYVAGDTIPQLAPSYHMIAAKTDLDMWFIPKAEVQEKFRSYPADILIDLNRGNNYVMQYLMLQHPATFKVGVRSSELDLYDLTISVTENTDMKHLFEHILFYLQTIRSK